MLAGAGKGHFQKTGGEVGGGASSSTSSAANPFSYASVPATRPGGSPSAKADVDNDGFQTVGARGGRGGGGGASKGKGKQVGNALRELFKPKHRLHQHS